MKQRGRPIGVILIKEPHPTILDDKLVYGQIFDYMHNLKVYFGLQYCFGILSTYNQWRILWDDGAHDLSQSLILPPAPETVPVERLDIPLVGSISLDTDTTNPASPTAKISRHLRTF